MTDPDFAKGDFDSASNGDAGASAIFESRLERIDVICTGGLYDDPELGRVSRHEKVKLPRLHVTRNGHVSKLYERGKARNCRLCGRSVPVGGSYVVTDASGSQHYEGGVWLRIAEWAARTMPDRRVITVDISDVRYPW